MAEWKFVAEGNNFQLVFQSIVEMFGKLYWKHAITNNFTDNTLDLYGFWN